MADDMNVLIDALIQQAMQQIAALQRTALKFSALNDRLGSVDDR
jgi:hypothetical protein